MDLNGTRMASLYHLFHANLRLRPAMDTYLARETAVVKNGTTNKDLMAYKRLLSITCTEAEWRTAAEFEACLRTCKGQIVLSQMENGFTGAMAAAVERKLRRELDSESPKFVIDSKQVHCSSKPIRA